MDNSLNKPFEHAVEAVTLALQSVTLRIEDHEKLRARKEADYKEFLVGWSADDSKLKAEHRNLATAIDVMHGRFAKISTGERFTRGKSSGRQAGRSNEGPSTVPRIIAAYNRDNNVMWQLSDLREYAIAKGMKFNEETLRKNLHKTRGRRLLVSLVYPGVRPAFYAPHEWLDMSDPNNIDLKPEHQNPVFSTRDGKKLRPKIMGLKGKEGLMP